jgi:hypothetical protein
MNQGVPRGGIPSDPVHIPRLRSCEMGYVAAFHVLHLLETFHAPAMVSVTLTYFNPLTDPFAWDSASALS